MTTPTNPDRPRLIEVAFPLRQASLDFVHEKRVRHRRNRPTCWFGYDFGCDTRDN